MKDGGKTFAKIRSQMIGLNRQTRDRDRERVVM